MIAATIKRNSDDTYTVKIEGGFTKETPFRSYGSAEAWVYEYAENLNTEVSEIIEID